MFQPVALFIGLRYTRAKRRNQFVSLISLVSMLGIALGVVVLITILSVLNGFDREIKKSIFGMMSPLTISTVLGRMENWRDLERTLETAPGITATAPFLNGQGLVQHGIATQPVIIIGIDPKKEARISTLGEKMVQGKLSHLATTQRGIVIGINLAKMLNVNVGDKMTVMIPKGSTSIANITARFEEFTVTGIFQAAGGGLAFDTKLAFINLPDAQHLFSYGKAISGLHATLNDIYLAPSISQQLTNQLSSVLQITNWTEQLGDFFENIKLTKTMMFFIFVLIIIVAIFNLIASLIMIVNNKQADIAILRTMGATPRTIMAVFIVQGAMVGVIGTALGVIGGILLATNVTHLVNLIQTCFNVQLVSSSVYFVDYLPSELQWLDVTVISVIALTLSLLGTLYPAWNASRMEPVDALRDR